MSTSLLRLRGALAAALMTAMVLALLTVVSADPAHADEVEGAVIDISVTPEDPAPDEIIYTNVEFCLPDGTSAGDTITVEVTSGNLDLFSRSFQITTPDGSEVVGTVDVVPDGAGGGTATLTLTDYASTRSDVCGQFFFGGRILGGATGTDYTFDFEVDDEGFSDTVTTTDGTTPPGRVGPRKFSFFTRNDQGFTNPIGAIQFGIDTPRGPFAVATIDDQLTDANGFTFDCDSIEYRLFDINDDNSLTEVGGTAPISEDCSPQSLQAEVGPAAADQLIRVVIVADITADLDVYENEVSVSLDGATAVARSSTLERVDDGGTAEGVAPAIGIVKGDEDGNPADTEDDAVDLGPAPGATGLVFTITNTGDEPLVNVEVTDDVIANGTVDNLDCLFPDDTTGTTWDGPFAVGDSFDCTADLSDVSAGEVHQDIATVTAVGGTSDTPVTDDNPYNAVSQPPEAAPDVEILKYDIEGNDADTPDDAADLGPEPGETILVFEITNTGDEALVDVEVTDEVITNGTVLDLVCFFPDESVGTTWDGPFAVGEVFDCAAVLVDVSAGEVHQDVATVTAVGEVSGLPVDDDNPYHAVADTPVTPPVTPNTPFVTPNSPTFTPTTTPFRIESGVPASPGMRSPLLVLVGFALLAGATVSMPLVGRTRRREHS